MKFSIIASLVGSLALISTAQAVEEKKTVSLEDELKTLSLPSNQAPSGISKEKLYSVQKRYTPLKKRVEFSLAAGRNFTTGGLLSSADFSGTFRYYLSPKWSLSLGGTFVTNKFTETFDSLGESQGVFPDVMYSKYKFDLSTTYHVFYGKFRLSMDNTFYFDQYVSLGPAYLMTNKGNIPGAALDVGIVFWMGKRYTARLGVKDYIYRKKLEASNKITNDLVFHFDVGLLLGKGE